MYLIFVFYPRIWFFTKANRPALYAPTGKVGFSNNSLTLTFPIYNFQFTIPESTTNLISLNPI